MHQIIGSWHLNEIVLYKCKIYSLSAFLSVIAISVVIFGCADPSVPIWSTKTISSDQRWVATASTIQTTGPGVNDVHTDAFVARADLKLPPTRVLGLSNNSVSPEGNTRLEMTWLTPTHLDIVYHAKAKVGFQVVKFSEIEISVHQE